jgi:hypothetical protein
LYRALQLQVAVQYLVEKRFATKSMPRRVTKPFFVQLRDLVPLLENRHRDTSTHTITPVLNFNPMVTGKKATSIHFS